MSDDKAREREHARMGCLGFVAVLGLIGLALVALLVAASLSMLVPGMT